MRRSHEISGKVLVLERGALADPNGYTKVSQPTPNYGQSINQ